LSQCEAKVNFNLVYHLKLFVEVLTTSLVMEQQAGFLLPDYLSVYVYYFLLFMPETQASFML